MRHIRGVSCGVAETFPKAQVTVDWFHIVQTFTGAIGAVRKAERQEIDLSKHTRWAVLKRADAGKLTVNQKQALAEMIDRDPKTATAWLIKDKLAWIRHAVTPQAAHCRLTHFVKFAPSWVVTEPLLAPMAKALTTHGEPCRASD